MKLSFAKQFMFWDWLKFVIPLNSNNNFVDWICHFGRNLKSNINLHYTGHSFKLLKLLQILRFYLRKVIHQTQERVCHCEVCVGIPGEVLFQVFDIAVCCM